MGNLRTNPTHRATADRYPARISGSDYSTACRARADNVRAGPGQAPRRRRWSASIRTAQQTCGARHDWKSAVGCSLERVRRPHLCSNLLRNGQTSSSLMAVTASPHPREAALGHFTLGVRSSFCKQRRKSALTSNRHVSGGKNVLLFHITAQDYIATLYIQTLPFFIEAKRFFYS